MSRTAPQTNYDTHAILHRCFPPKPATCLLCDCVGDELHTHACVGWEAGRPPRSYFSDPGRLSTRQPGSPLGGHSPTEGGDMRPTEPPPKPSDSHDPSSIKVTIDGVPLGRWIRRDDPPEHHDCPSTPVEIKVDHIQDGYVEWIVKLDNKVHKRAGGLSIRQCNICQALVVEDFMPQHEHWHNELD